MSTGLEDKSGLELAKSTYTLVDPIAASEQLWNAYTAERLAVQDAFGTVLISGEEECDEEFEVIANIQILCRLPSFD